MKQERPWSDVDLDSLRYEHADRVAVLEKAKDLKQRFSIESQDFGKEVGEKVLDEGWEHLIWIRERPLTSRIKGRFTRRVDNYRGLYKGDVQTELSVILPTINSFRHADFRSMSNLLHGTDILPGFYFSSMKYYLPDIRPIVDTSFVLRIQNEEPTRIAIQRRRKSFVKFRTEKKDCTFGNILSALDNLENMHRERHHTLLKKKEYEYALSQLYALSEMSERSYPVAIRMLERIRQLSLIGITAINDIGYDANFAEEISRHWSYGVIYDAAGTAASQFKDFREAQTLMKRMKRNWMGSRQIVQQLESKELGL